MSTGVIQIEWELVTAGLVTGVKAPVVPQIVIDQVPQAKSITNTTPIQSTLIDMRQTKTTTRSFIKKTSTSKSATRTKTSAYRTRRSVILPLIFNLLDV